MKLTMKNTVFVLRTAIVKKSCITLMTGSDLLLSILKCANRLLKYEVVSVNVSVFNGLDQI